MPSTPNSTPQRTGSSPIRLNSRKPGPIETKVREATSRAADALEADPRSAVVAELAGHLAAVVDAARRANDVRTLMSAADRLRELLDTLPLTIGSPSDGDHGSPRVPNSPAELEELMGAGPTVGDTAQP